VPKTKDPGTRTRHQAAVIFLLTKAPRTPSEIAHLLGMQPHGSLEHVKVWLRIWEEEGLVQRAGERQNTHGRPSPVWEWIAYAPAKVEPNNQESPT